MSNFASPFMFKSPLNDLRKANSSRKTKKRQPMKDCEGFECSKSEASLNRKNKTKTRTKTHIDNARGYAKDSAPLNQNTVGENTGEVKKDKEGSYVLRSERSVAGAKGDTIRIPNNKFIEDGYLVGGDYETKKTGDKSFEITKQK
jgi:hypothetical protein